MTIAVCIVLVVILWTIVGIARFISQIGDKYGENQKWFDYILYVPVFAISSFIGWLYSKFG